MAAPDIIVIGRVAVQHQVPARPGPWQARLAGSALWAAAGARLWAGDARIGVVARLGAGLPMDVPWILREAGLDPDGLRLVPQDHLIEWVLEEDDGSRRVLARNPELRDPHLDPTLLRRRHRQRIEALSPAASDVPDDWLQARAALVLDQPAAAHARVVAALVGRVKSVLSEAPLEHGGLDVGAISVLFRGVAGLLARSDALAHLAADGDWRALALRLVDAGIPEAVLRLGAAEAIVAQRGGGLPLRAAAPPGDAPADEEALQAAFAGAYAACRLAAMAPGAAARRAAVAAALVARCADAAEALALDPAAAARRLAPRKTLFARRRGAGPLPALEEDAALDPDAEPGQPSSSEESDDPFAALAPGLVSSRNR